MPGAQSMEDDKFSGTDSPDLERTSSRNRSKNPRNASPTRLSPFELKNNTSATNLDIENAENFPPDSPSPANSRGIPKGSSAANTDTIMQEVDADASLLQPPETQPPEASQTNEKKRTWSDLFVKKERGRSTYVFSAPIRGPKTKNKNAIIYNISHLTNAPSDHILQALGQRYGEAILGAKFRFTRRGRTHIEVIFGSMRETEWFLSTGLELMGQTIRGYFATQDDRTFLTIRLNNMPIYNKDSISETIQDLFTKIAPVRSIRPLVYAGTKFLTDQWLVTLDITDIEHVTTKIPRILDVLGFKVTTSWKAAPPLCHFCDKEGHFRKDCADLALARAGKTALNNSNKELTESSSLQTKPPAQTEKSPAASPLKDAAENPFLEEITPENAQQASLFTNSPPLTQNMDTEHIDLEVHSQPEENEIFSETCNTPAEDLSDASSEPPSFSDPNATPTNLSRPSHSRRDSSEEEPFQKVTYKKNNKKNKRAKFNSSRSPSPSRRNPNY